MNFKYCILLLLLQTMFVQGQDNSKGDDYFFEYAYKDAIEEYTKEKEKKILSNQQFLNLADSYYKTGSFEEAGLIYKDIYAKDSTLSDTYINRLLLTVRKLDSVEAFDYFLEKSRSFFTNELKENAEFNFEIIQKNQNKKIDFFIFNCYLNSPQADFSPAFYIDDELMFTSARQQGKKSKIYGPSGESYLGIYSGKIQPDGDVTVPKMFTEIPKSIYHKATPFYSEELDGIFYVLSNADGEDLLYNKKGKNTLAIGSVNEKGTFQYLLRDLSTSFYYPFYDGKNEKLYFAANFEGGFGGTDIYYVHTNDGRIMSAPVNLGPRINTPGNEIAPFIYEGSMYFSSDIFYGFGGMDIYTSNLQLDESFSIPVNLGTGINSTADDFGFIIKNQEESGLLGYFSSNREGGKGNDDIYGFKVDEKPGIKTLMVKGVVTNPSYGREIPGTTVKLYGDENQVLKSYTTSAKGEYQFEVPWRTDFKIEASKSGYGTFVKSFDINEENTFDGIVDISLPFIEDLIQEKEEKTVVKMSKFYFDRGASKLTAGITKELDKVIIVTNSFPNIKLKVESYTDSRGSSAKNLQLSIARSETIKKYLIEKGVDPSIFVEAVGYGEDRLLNQCKDGVYCLEFLHNQNVRSYITIINYDELVK
ncbi:OmpA family protein [Cellulophaga sp. HaHaR_3_176]|uniref:OmpA family protein n=1 Tax=Cellulophaga sp. HaHaR_3_176 TaxID=1942464 RepID=UPI001C1FC01B|nr:OmpA family protein [Cellulophaga sp. HaHaR_3_176]QWX84101.1 OmpA family protein [Cellulophaga sp. HaHaR_3_176]